MPRGIYDRSKLAHGNKSSKSAGTINRGAKTGGRSISKVGMSSRGLGRSLSNIDENFANEFVSLQQYYGTLVQSRVTLNMTFPEIDQEIRDTLIQLKLYREQHFIKAASADDTLPVDTDHDDDDEVLNENINSRVNRQTPVAASPVASAPVVSAPRPFVPVPPQART